MTGPGAGPDLPAHRLGALQVAEALDRGSLTSVALVEHLLARIDAHEPQLRALIAVHPAALDRAREADRRRRGGRPRSGLDGVPVIVKDSIEARGLPGTAGSLALVGCPPGRDAPLTARLRRAGLVVLAAANLSEWANFRGRGSPSGWSAAGGLTDNPWRPGRSAGGSSSGCGAAVAAGYVPLAVGTETDGSITCPAALCGVVGLKATVGAIPTAGVVPVSASQDSLGPMGRCVADVRALLAVLAGRLPRRREEVLPGRRWALATPRQWLTGHARTDAHFAAVVARLRRGGIEITEVEVPDADAGVATDEVTVLVHEMAEDLGAYLAARPGAPNRIADVVAFNDAHADVELAHFGQEYLAAAAGCAGRAAPAYRPARARCLAWALDGVLRPALRGGVDALIGPAYGPAWRSDLVRGDAFLGGAVTTPAAIAGWPILTMPMGLVAGLPVGLSLVAPRGGDGRLLAVAADVERLLAAQHWPTGLAD